jgi:APA family basic amino acid/polyamine antiporter
MTSSADAGSRPSLGFWRAWALVVGGTMGSSVFMLPALAAPYGGIGFVGLAAAGVGGLCVALTFAALARRLPTAGGPITYTRAAFGDFAGFLVAWIYWIGQWTAGGAIAVAIPGYLGQLVPAASSGTLATTATALAVLWVTVGINWWGVREAGIVGLVVTMLKLVPLVVVAFIGPAWVDWQQLPAWNPRPEPALVAFVGALSIGFWNYVGIESATVPADDVIDAERTVPRATIAGVFTCIVVYQLIAIVSLGTIPAAELAASSTPLADVGAYIAGPVGAVSVSIAAVGSICAVLHYVVLVAGQAPAAAARDGLFPAVFNRRTRHGTPGFALLVAGLLISAIVVMNSQEGLVGAYRFMALLSTLATMIPYALCAIAILLLPPAEGQPAGARRAAIAVAVVAFAVSVVVVAGAGAEVAYWTLLLILAGLPAYALIRRREKGDGTLFPARSADGGNDAN